MSGSITLTIGGSLDLILRQPPPPEPEVQDWVSVRYGSFVATGRSPMAYILPSQHFIGVQVSYADAAGNAATVDGEVVWASSDEAVCNVTAEPAAGGVGATITALGPTGSAQITATADADLGEGTRTLVTLLDITVVAGEAVAGTITVDADPQPVP